MATKHPHRRAGSTYFILVAAIAIVATGVSLLLLTSTSTTPQAGPRKPPVRAKLSVRVERFSYTTHNGTKSYAIVVLPGWYGPQRHPAIPLVIAPHGRNTMPESAAKRWYDLPTRGSFAVVLPAGQGRVLQLYSWGYPGQIADLARMPALAEQAVPGFHYLRDHVYAIGTSMGGQEALLLLGRNPGLLAGVIAFDPATDLADRYREFAEIPSGRKQQRQARIEVGGTPRQAHEAYAIRSPITYAHQIAGSNVPVELWWSTTDEVIVDQARQTGRLYRELERLNPEAPVDETVGRWHHGGESWYYAKLPAALARIGLLPKSWLADDPLYRSGWQSIAEV